MPIPRYSQEQVLRGLRTMWSRLSYEQAADFDANTRLDEYVDYPDYYMGDIEKFFRFSIAREEWRKLLGLDIADHDRDKWMAEFVPQLTFGVLARFIAARAPVVELEPAIIAGRRCAPAGAYLGIATLANEFAGYEKHFGPSTKIHHVLERSGVRRLWEQLGWLTRSPMPTLPSHREFVFNAAWIILAIGLLATIAPFTPEPIAIGLGSYLCFVFLVCISFSVDHFTNPLPPNIKTFRDLAVYVSKIKCDTTQETY